MNEISVVVSFLDQLADWEHQCTLVATVYIPDFVLQLFCLQAARQTLWNGVPGYEATCIYIVYLTQPCSQAPLLQNANIVKLGVCSGSRLGEPGNEATPYNNDTFKLMTSVGKPNCK